MWEKIPLLRGRYLLYLLGEEPYHGEKSSYWLYPDSDTSLSEVASTLVLYDLYFVRVLGFGTATCISAIDMCERSR